MMRVAVLMLMLASVMQAQAASRPVFSDTGPDAEAYGAAQGFPVPSPPVAALPTQEFMVGWHSHYDRFRQMRTVHKADKPSVLKRAEEEINPVYPYEGRYNFIKDYLERNPVTGLLIARDDTILSEHYRYGRTDEDRFLSESMVKTITGLLIGIGISEGAIRSVDDTAATYVPELAGTEYGATPLRALLHMASGVTFHETYEPGDDSLKLSAALLWPGATGAVAALKQFNSREAAPGTRFSYSSADTEVLGLVVSRAVHMTLADYLSTRIWQKLGTEADAAWAIDPTGQEVAYCCFVATLRDWARLALMLAHDGAWNGQQIVPRQWLLDATSVTAANSFGALSERLGGYGYQLFVLAGDRRTFLLRGIYGQAILVDPETHLVAVQTAVRLEPTGGPKSLEGGALWYAIVAQYGHQ